jgi:FMN phosphatase YigB (HAD superfamily)
VSYAGVKLAVVSNFDTRLRPLLEQLNIAQAFDTLIISAEVQHSLESLRTLYHTGSVAHLTCGLLKDCPYSS